MQKYPNLFFHSIRFRFETLEKILESGYILSREKSGSTLKTVTFNGNKWISLCQYFDSNDQSSDYFEKSAYQILIINGISIVLKKGFPATRTSFMSYDDLYPGIIKDDDHIRYSDCIDEYQARDSISREFFLAIAYPYLNRLSKDERQAQIEYDQIRHLLSKYNYDLPIIDSSHGVIEQELERLEKRLTK